MTQHHEGALTERAIPGPALYCLTTKPETTPKAVVGLLHGYADHGARYAHVMDRWAERGIASVAIDMRGHGRATGLRGYCARFDEFLDDAAELTRLVADGARGAPAFLFGHSFGGYASISMVEQSPRFRAAVAVAPPTDLLSLYGSFPAFLRYDNLYSGEMVAQSILETGIVRMGAPPLGNDLYRYIENSPIAYVDKIASPILFVQGDIDHVPMQQSEEIFSLMNRIGKKARFVRYWGEEHLIESPANIRDFWQQVFRWLKEN